MDNNKNIYTVNDESIEKLYDSLVMLGIDSLDDYFKLIEKTVYTKKSSNIKRKKINIDIKPMINTIRNHKITKTDVKVITLAFLFSVGIISFGKITKDINNTKERNEITTKIINEEKDFLLEQGIVMETNIGKKDNVIIVGNPNYSNITVNDITPIEVYNFMLFIQSNYEELYTQKRLLNDFIQAQTYNDGTMYYLDWNDYLKQNNFNNNKEFMDYCYQNIKSNNKLIRKR